MPLFLVSLVCNCRTVMFKVSGFYVCSCKIGLGLIEGMSKVAIG